MSKAESLQEALKNASGKAPKPPSPKVKPAPEETDTPLPAPKPGYRDGKENIGSFLPGDFGISLRMVQLRKRKANGRKVFLDELMAEAFNDLFIKYDVPTVEFSKD